MSHQEVVKLIKCEFEKKCVCPVYFAVKKKKKEAYFCFLSLVCFGSFACVFLIPSPFFFFNRPVAGTYVALTLQGPPPSTASLPLEPLPSDLAPNQRTSLGGEAPPSPPPPLPSGLSNTPSQRITGPKPLQVNDIILTTIIPRQY